MVGALRGPARSTPTYGALAPHGGAPASATTYGSPPEVPEYSKASSFAQAPAYSSGAYGANEYPREKGQEYTVPPAGNPKKTMNEGLSIIFIERLLNVPGRSGDAIGRFKRIGSNMYTRWTYVGFAFMLPGINRKDRLATFNHLFVCRGTHVLLYVRRHAVVQYCITFDSTITPYSLSEVLNSWPRPASKHETKPPKSIYYVDCSLIYNIQF